MEQRIVELYDSFTHGVIDRRTFMDRLTVIAGSSAAAVALLPVLQNDYALAETVAANDSRLVTEKASYDAGGTRMSGYLARLKGGSLGGAKRPAVLVIHENRGLNPHIEDVTRRVALEGFLAFGIDALSPLGGTPADEEKGREMIASLNGGETAQRIAAAVPFLAGHAESTGNVGAVGFCWGGSMVNRIATLSPELKAGAPYYGGQPPAADVPKIHAAMMLQYAGLDSRINAGIPAYEEALKAGGKRYTIHMYPDVNHAFNNDTTSRYDKAAADLAWSRTIAFFKEQLGAPPRA